ncbi:transposase [Bacillus alkalicola]|uniref:Transposase n=2 Tax=Bacillaceae TaxID=186817 RepID=A0ABS6K059_9BACI|nr:transposase [Bacillus alkalicola]MBU9724235.1 transposase [Bacillus alkalicola]
MNEEEERQFKEEVHAMNPKESEKIMEIITSYEKKGMELKSIEVARRMLEKNMSLDEIAEITGLSLEKVESLKRN